MTIKVNDQAPDFHLISSDKQEVKLGDYKGKNVVLLFFPLAFTGTCTEELCEIRDQWSEYKSLNAHVLAVSVDSPFVLEKYKEEHKMTCELLSDFNKDASTAYGAIYESFAFGMKGVSKRSAFVIDGEGTIKYAEVLEDPTELPNFASIKNTLSELN